MRGELLHTPPYYKGGGDSLVGREVLILPLISIDERSIGANDRTMQITGEVGACGVGGKDVLVIGEVIILPGTGGEDG